MKCIIIDKMHPSIAPALEGLGLEVDYFPEINQSEILQIIGTYEGLIVRSKVSVDKTFLDQAPNLKFVARAGAGTDNLDTDELETRGIKIINAPEGNRDTLAEHTVGLLLSLLNKIHLASHEVKSLQWNREANRGEELMGKTVAIFGYGNMGQAVAHRLKSFGVEIIAYDKYKNEIAEDFVRLVPLKTIFNKTDVLSLHIPLTQETRHLVNETFIQKFKKPFYLINTARGEIVSLKALKYYLDQNAILGAALDVLENEKFDALNAIEMEILKEIINSRKIIITPHIAGWSHQSYVRINEVLINKIKNYLSE
ncbi:MAG TPA: NAD(P)-dependent oxidoreductase [Cyclobacteriaceae bacterium]